MANKKGKRTRAEARKMMWEYYTENKTSLPKWIRKCREEILDYLVRGLDPESAFKRCSKDEYQTT